VSEFLLTVDEFAEASRLNVWTVRRYVRQGTIKAKRIGTRHCILASEAERFLGFRPEKPKPQKKAS
jgi:excisionase family DNA binding protein